MTTLKPTLRFSEFTENWEVKTLGELLEFKNGINAAKEQYGSGAKFINVLDILNNNFITHDKIVGSVNVDIQTLEKYSVSYGDVLFQRSSETREEVGSANVYLDENQKATFGGFVIRGKKIGNYNPVFLNKLLKTDKARDNITSKSGGSTRYNVGQETLSSVSLLFPTLPEQTKIANFLTATDQKIEALKEKKSLIQEYKKGIMQQLFSQELRFKNTNSEDYPDWEIKSLGEVGEIVTGKTPDTFDKSLWDGDIQFVTPTDIKEDDKYQMNVVRFVTKTKNIKPLPPKSVLFTCIASIGKMSLSVNSCITNQQINALIPSERYENEYIYYVLVYITPKIKSTQANTTLPIINKTEFAKFKIPIPSLSEQIKIANFLTAIDEKIEKINQQITDTQTFKKGLLQQMFV